MDGTDTWKQILLEWVCIIFSNGRLFHKIIFFLHFQSQANSTQFLSRTYYSLNKTDIYAFFTAYQSSIKTENIGALTLLQFLQGIFFINNFGNNKMSIIKNTYIFFVEYYPQFEVKLDPADRLQASTFVDIYSLFLHFACVRYPQKELQNLCNGLKDLSQVRIAAFFTALMTEQSHINHAVIQMAIGESSVAVTAAKCQRTDVDLLSPIRTGSGGGGSSSDGGGSTIFSPPTPRTKLLDNWNSENKMLKVLGVVFFI